MITCGRTAVCTCMWEHVCACVPACVCVHVCVPVRVYIYRHALAALCVHAHGHACMCMHGCARMCMCVHVCPHIHAPTAVHVCYPNVKVLCPAPAQELCSIGIIYKGSAPRKPAHVAPWWIFLANIWALWLACQVYRIKRIYRRSNPHKEKNVFSSLFTSRDMPMFRLPKHMNVTFYRVSRV